VTLLWDPDSPERSRKLRWTPYLAEPSDPEHNTIWQAEVIQQVRNQILSEIHLTGKARFEFDVVVSPMWIVEAWSHVDPRVKSLLADGK